MKKKEIRKRLWEGDEGEAIEIAVMLSTQIIHTLRLYDSNTLLRCQRVYRPLV